MPDRVRHDTLMPSIALSLLWFVVIVAMIPLALWLLKRTRIGGAGSTQLMRTVGSLPLSPSQRLVTVELGSGEDKRWLVLGVTSQSITTVYSMLPQELVPNPAVATPAPPFAQLLAGLRGARQPKDGSAL
jgi:flagellar protein FliO/FliZ